MVGWAAGVNEWKNTHTYEQTNGEKEQMDGWTD